MQKDGATGGRLGDRGKLCYEKEVVQYPDANQNFQFSNICVSVGQVSVLKGYQFPQEQRVH